MLERELQDAILEAAEILGWRCVHFRPARTKHGWRTPVQGKHAAGFPDILMVRKGRIVALELKAKGQKPTAEQEAWLADLAACAHVTAAVICPTDWTSGFVDRVLR